MESVYILSGFAHDFQTLSDDLELHYCHSAPYNPIHESAINVTDETLEFAWPLPIANLLDRDKNNIVYNS